MDDHDIITLREAIEAFPSLLDQKVTFGSKNTNGPLLEATEASFQFVDSENRGYRTEEVESAQPSDSPSKVWQYRPKVC